MARTLKKDDLFFSLCKGSGLFPVSFSATFQEGLWDKFDCVEGLL